MTHLCQVLPDDHVHGDVLTVGCLHNIVLDLLWDSCGEELKVHMVDESNIGHDHRVGLCTVNSVCVVSLRLSKGTRGVAN